LFFAGRGNKTNRTQLLEPDKCEGWEWIRWEEVKAFAAKEEAGASDGRKFFLPILNLIEHRPGVDPGQNV
jgi:8-oxo-dGTP diphosphatase